MNSEVRPDEPGGQSEAGPSAAEPEVARVSAVHVHRMVVPSSDVDGLGHASNVAYLRWVQDAAVSHSDAVGWPFSRYEQTGTAFLVRRHEIDYLRPAFGGEALLLETWIERWTAATSVRRTLIRREPDASEIARALTIWALVTRKTGRPRRVPPELREAFAGPLRAMPA